MVRVPPSRSPFPVTQRQCTERTPGCDQAVMTACGSLVSVVDDDESVRESLPDLLRQFGFTAEAFSSAEAFLASDRVSETSCLILDVAMPGMSGPDLQRELTRRRQKIPIVFITAYGDGSVGPRLLARGAVKCLVKPFSEATLLDAVRAALDRPWSRPVTAT
jgi:FixJ family two-component response regulator